MNNMNIDENTIQNIKNMVDNGNISEAMSNISPEMIQNFSKLLSNQDNKQNSSNEKSNTSDSNGSQNSIPNNQSTSNESNDTSNNNFDFSNIDMNTIMKMSSVFGKMNNSKDDPRANLLKSLKPYLRDSKKGKLDNYMNLLNISKITDILKENNKENNKDV